MQRKRYNDKNVNVKRKEISEEVSGEISNVLDTSSPLFISVKCAASRYGLSESTIRAMVHQEGFPKVLKVGKKICIPIKEFDCFMMEKYYN